MYLTIYITFINGKDHLLLYVTWLIVLIYCELFFITQNMPDYLTM